MDENKSPQGNRRFSHTIWPEKIGSQGDRLQTQYAHIKLIQVFFHDFLMQAFALFQNTRNPYNRSIVNVNVAFVIGKWVRYISYPYRSVYIKFNFWSPIFYPSVWPNFPKGSLSFRWWGIFQDCSLTYIYNDILVFAAFSDAYEWMVVRLLRWETSRYRQLIMWSYQTSTNVLQEFSLNEN